MTSGPSPEQQALVDIGEVALAGSSFVLRGGLGPVFGPGGLAPTGRTADTVARTQGQLVTAGLNDRFSSSGY